jgi:hypothetical protein
MPQPVLHVMLADAHLERWRTLPGRAPFDADDARCRNAFLVGSLAPDLGLFPGGEPLFSRLAHTQHTADLVRALVRGAAAPWEVAFAHGWLSHFLADVAIHPLVNEAAAATARVRAPTLLDHVRVEVGFDAWLAWRHPVLRTLRLSPAFDERGTRFLGRAFTAVYERTFTAAELLRMQRGLLRFTHLALHFATDVARDVCWKEAAGEAPAPLASAALWRTVSLLTTRRSTMYAYLNPLRPDGALLDRVAAAISAYEADFERYVHGELPRLPDCNLETGELIPRERAIAGWAAAEAS